MKCNFRILLGLVLLPLLGSSPAVASQEAPVKPANPRKDPAIINGLEDLPQIVARVEERQITRWELIRELTGAGADIAMDRIALRMAVDLAAEAAGVKATPEELDTQLKTDKLRLSNEVRRKPWELAPPSFEEIVRQEFQMSVEEYRDTYARQRLLTRKLLGTEIRATEEDLRKVFLKNEELFQPRARYHAAHILITPVNPNDNFRSQRFQSPVRQKMELLKDHAENANTYKQRGIKVNDEDLNADPEWQYTRQRAQMCLQELNSGRISWDQAVAKYTQDPQDLPTPPGYKLGGQLLNGKSIRAFTRPATGPGDIGSFDANGPMVKEFYEQAKSIQKGKIGGPFRTEFGWHIVRMLDVEELPRKTFEECRSEVERVYFDLLLQKQSEKWVTQLMSQVNLEFSKSLVWPSVTDLASQQTADPVVGRVNGMPVLRSTLWKDLLRLDGPGALQRLINMELVLGPLKRLGPERLEWESVPRERRSANAPPILPVFFSPADLDVELTDDRLALDSVNNRLKKSGQPVLSFDEFIFKRYGKTPEEYRRGIECQVVLSKAMQRVVKLDPIALRMEFSLARELYEEPIWFEAAHILFEIKPEAGPEVRANAMKIAKIVKSKITKGGNWDEEAANSQDELTRENSGFIGALRPDSLGYEELYTKLTPRDPETNAVVAPETGQLVIVETSRGVHLVKIIRRHAARLPEFEDVSLRKRIERDYILARSNTMMEVWMRALKGKKDTAVEKFAFVPPDNGININLNVPDK